MSSYSEAALEILKGSGMRVSACWDTPRLGVGLYKPNGDVKNPSTSTEHDRPDPQSYGQKLPQTWSYLTVPPNAISVKKETTTVTVNTVAKRRNFVILIRVLIMYIFAGNHHFYVRGKSRQVSGVMPFIRK